MEKAMTSLAEIPEGGHARVLKLRSSGALKQRLLDMGIGRGTILTVERYAPLRDPIQIRVKDYSLALRVAEGRQIEVEKILP